MFINSPAETKMGNMTVLRRQSEFIQILKEMGGIANTMTPEFGEKHVNLLSTLKDASAPVGTEIDKRTMKETLIGMADKQMLKMTTVVLQGAHGHDKSCRVFYLPDLDQATINDYIVSLNKFVGYRPSQLPKLSEPVEFAKTVDRKGNTVEEIRSSSPEVVPVYVSEEDLIRRRILEDKPVIMQSAGFITGRLARAKELHLFLRSQMSDVSRSSHFVSPNIFRTQYLWEDLPLATHCGMVSVMDIFEPLIEYLAVEENRWTPCKLVPAEISDHILLGRMRSRRALLEVLRLLQRLQILVPLIETDSDSPYITCQTGSTSHSFDISVDHASVMPSHWMFNDQVPLFKFNKRQNPPPYIGQYDVSTEPGRLRFWEDFEVSSLSSADELPAVENDVPEFLAADLLRTANKISSWIRDYRISHTQRQYLGAFVDPATGYHPFTDDPTLLHHASYMTGAPYDAIMNFLDRKSREIIKLTARLKRRQEREARERRKAKNAKAILAAKAEEQRRRVERDWEDYLSTILPTPRPEGTETRLAAIHDTFIKTNGRHNRKFKYDSVKNDILFALGLGSRRRPGALPAEFRTRLQRPLGTNYFPAARLHNPVETKSVYDLINQQEPRSPGPADTRKKKGKSKAKEGDLEGSWFPCFLVLSQG